MIPQIIHEKYWKFNILYFQTLYDYISISFPSSRTSNWLGQLSNAISISFPTKSGQIFFIVLLILFQTWVKLELIQILFGSFNCQTKANYNLFYSH